jgi:hypothetical protein
LELSANRRLVRSGQRGGLIAHLRELVHYRELIYNLTVRELKSR